MEIAINWFIQEKDRRGDMQFYPGTKQDHSGVSINTLDVEVAKQVLTVLDLGTYTHKLSKSGKSVTCFPPKRFVGNDVVVIPSNS